jgi:hypothetical protein
MRSGDFGVEVVAHGTGRVRELDTGHVLARPGQVYRLRLRNHGPLRCVVDVRLDGQGVTAGGLVLEPWGTTELERPVDAAEDGRFTVIAEGNEAVFGPDGGRDDPSLGVVEASFRRELPRRDRSDRVPDVPVVFMPPARPLPGAPVEPPRPRWPTSPRIPEWEPPMNHADDSWPPIAMASAYQSPAKPAEPSVRDRSAGISDIERAAGTGLTGHSDQRFVPAHVGPLESEATVIRLRIVIGTEEALADELPRPLTDRQAAPARPAARP